MNKPKKKTQRREKQGRTKKATIERGEKVRARVSKRAGLFWVSGATSAPHFTV